MSIILLKLPKYYLKLYKRLQNLNMNILILELKSFDISFLDLDQYVQVISTPLDVKVLVLW